MSREHSIGTIRKWKTREFTVIVDALPEDDPMSALEFDEDGETAAAIDRGDLQLFVARARVIHNVLGEIASDYLGACIYKDFAEFMDHKECAATNRKLKAEGSAAVCGSHFAGMVRRVISEARVTLLQARRIRVREMAP